MKTKDQVRIELAVDSAKLRKALIAEQEEKEKLVGLLKLSYRNWLEDPDVAWNELGGKLCDGLCEAMGDNEFQVWLQLLDGKGGE